MRRNDRLTGSEPSLNHFQAISGAVQQVSEGSLYLALQKLEQKGSITVEWKQTENNRHAEFFRSPAQEEAIRIRGGELAPAIG
ncbi:MAG: helix-turn-helix transcriptional regulator [Candidatus Acidiferrales bacterium]